MTGIIHISTVHVRTDTRIFFKELTSLSKKYKTKFIVADGLGNEVKKSIEIIDLGKPKNKVFRILFFWIKAFIKIKSKNFKIIHFHDPELIPLGIVLKIMGLKVIYDIHELVYYDIVSKNWIKPKLIRKIIGQVYLIFESFAVNIFDGIILAEEGYKEFYKKKYKKIENKLLFINNYPKISLLNHDMKFQKKEDYIIYLGAISEDRGIKELIQSLKYLNDKIKLLLIGKWSNKKFLEDCQKIESWKRVIKLGYISPQEIGSHIEKCQIGMCTLHPLENFAYTKPVKSFEYLAKGLPMIMTNFPYWQTFYKNAAVFVNPKNPIEISNAIVKLLNDRKLYSSMSKNGKLLSKKYSWEIEEKKLFKFYSQLI